MKRIITKLMLIALLLGWQTMSVKQPASAEVIQQSWETIPLSVYQDCTKEWVNGFINVHLIWIVNDGKVDSIHTNVQGAAIGQTSGTQYVYHNNYKDNFVNFSCGGIATARAHSRWISQGSAPNLDVNFLITYAFDANCNELPPVVTVVDSRCQ